MTVKARDNRRMRAPQTGSAAHEPADRNHDHRADETLGGTSRGSAGRALALLEAVTAAPRSMSLAELSATLEMSKPTTHRIATALEELGFLEREPGGRRFIEGQRLIDLALNVMQAAAQRSLRRSILEALSERTGETINFGVLTGSEIVYLDRIEAKWPLGLRFEPGSRVPAHCTALGKLLLSQLPERELRRRLSVLPMQRYTDNTITDPDRLDGALATIRDSTIGTDDQEFMAGVVCVAVPVTRPDGKLCGGIALSAPEARVTLEEALELVPQLRAAAEQLGSTFAAGDGAETADEQE